LELLLHIWQDYSVRGAISAEYRSRSLRVVAMATGRYKGTGHARHGFLAIAWLSCSHIIFIRKKLLRLVLHNYLGLVVFVVGRS